MNLSPQKRFLDYLAKRPRLWNLLRNIAEAGFNAEKRIIELELEPFNSRGQQRLFIDMGCGTGEFASSFPRSSYIGIDCAKQNIVYAKRHLQGRFLVMSGDALGFRDMSFDDGVIVGVLHHMPGDLRRATIRELSRVLRRNAKLLIMEDVPTKGYRNLFGHVMHYLDRGDYICKDEEYRHLFSQFFSVVRSYPIRSGICDLIVFVLRKS
jgi:SAM-dependent methyltransferase